MCHVGREASHVPKTASGFSIYRGKHRLARIFYNLHPKTFCQCHNGRHISRQSKQVHWDYHSGFRVGVCFVVQVFQIHVERNRINIHKNRSKIILQHHVRRSNKSDRRDQHFVPILVAMSFLQRGQCDLQSACSAVAKNSIFAAVHFRKLFLQPICEFATRKSVSVQAFVYVFLPFRAYRQVA